MQRKILITGGAGFIGSHVADELLKYGYKVRVLDNLSPQVHGLKGSKPEYLSREIEFIYGDVRDPVIVEKSLEGVEAVYHFAAAVGVGQSMYEIERYTSVNNLGTAVLLEGLIKQPVRRLIVASSMSIYGEGLYKTSSGEISPEVERTLEQLKAGVWELYDKQGNILYPVPTPESKRPSIASIYALSKYDQEQMSLITGKAYNIPVVALRFFNVYGTRQSLSNPYTGVLAIFGARYLNNRKPLIFEDGNQKRDFVSVYDVARACRLAMEIPNAIGQVFNIGSGVAYTVSEIAEKLAYALSKENLHPVIQAKYRIGDIRHCFADITLARQILGYKPQISLEDGLAELTGWLEGQVAFDQADIANSELDERGLRI